MDDRIDEIFAELRDAYPPDDLNSGIMASVGRARLRRRALGAFLYAALGATAPAIFLSLKLFISDLSESPLTQLLNLVLTDSGEVARSLGDWAMAVLESLPIGSLALSLGALLALAVLANRIAVLTGPRHHHIRETV